MIKGKKKLDRNLKKTTINLTSLRQTSNKLVARLIFWTIAGQYTTWSIPAGWTGMFTIRSKKSNAFYVNKIRQINNSRIHSREMDCILKILTCTFLINHSKSWTTFISETVNRYIRFFVIRWKAIVVKITISW